MPRRYYEGTWQKKRAFSPAVISQGGGTLVFVAGHTGQTTPEGKSNAGDFDAQVRQMFKNIDATLKEAGGSLKDIVTMTVFIIDARLSDRFTELRHEIFGGKEFPASALITVAGFADQRMMVEVQSIAVIGDR